MREYRGKRKVYLSQAEIKVTFTREQGINTMPLADIMLLQNDNDT